MSPYRRLFGIGRKLVGVLLVACPGTDGFSYLEWVTGDVCPWVSHLAVSSAARDVGTSHGIGAVKPNLPA